ncbi:MAG TPA: hypothetical protein VGC21_04595 [Telluria sp.]
MKPLLQHVATLKTLLRMPVASLRFDPRIEPVNVASTYRYYTKPHPKYKLIQHKSWGAALIDLRHYHTRDNYLECIKGKNCGAYHARRARSRGYVTALIDRNAHIEAIHAINVSVGQRQGRPMDASYQRKQAHFDVLGNFHYYGVLDQTGKLVAYANIGRYGNFSAFSHLIGYRNNDGIMHLMVSDIVSRLIDAGEVEYVMYDTFFGALPGMQQFKTILGFQPYRARYSLQ